MRGNGTHSNLHLVLVGPPPQMHETAKLNFGSMKILIAFIPLTKSWKLIWEYSMPMRFLLFPSTSRNSVVPLETTSHGIPVITTKTGAMADILGENAYRWPHWSVELEKAIQKALISPHNQRTVFQSQQSMMCPKPPLFIEMSHRGNDWSCFCLMLPSLLEKTRFFKALPRSRFPSKMFELGFSFPSLFVLWPMHP